MTFKLIKKSADQQLTRFQVLDSEETGQIGRGKPFQKHNAIQKKRRCSRWESPRAQGVWLGDDFH